MLAAGPDLDGLIANLERPGDARHEVRLIVLLRLIGGLPLYEAEATAP